MTEKNYTESELRQKLTDKADQIANGIVGKLRDANFFKIHSIPCTGILSLDGKVVSDWEPFHKLFGEVLETFYTELMSTVLAALFDDEAV